MFRPTWQTSIASLSLAGTTFPIFDQNGQKFLSFADRNGSKTTPFLTAHTYIHACNIVVQFYPWINFLFSFVFLHGSVW